MLNSEPTNNKTLPLRLSNLAQAQLIRVVCYYDVFEFPLTLTEIFDNSTLVCEKKEIEQELLDLVSKGILDTKNGFFFLKNRPTHWIEKRTQGECLHQRAKDHVIRYSRFIASFPFVRGVYMSGSYSKGVMRESDDYDYFVITAKNRLWLCRSLLRGYKKFFLKRSEHFFCMNYFLEEGNLLVPDHNRFVATEVRTIVPTFNFPLYQRFQEANNWTDNYLPNRSYYKQALLNPQPTYKWKNFFEKCLNGFLGNWLEKRLFHFMEKRRRKQFKHFNEADFNLNMRTQKQAEKHHPNGTQQKVLTAYQERLSLFDLTVE